MGLEREDSAQRPERRSCVSPRFCFECIRDPYPPFRDLFPVHGLGVVKAVMTPGTSTILYASASWSLRILLFAIRSLLFDRLHSA